MIKCEVEWLKAIKVEMKEYMIRKEASEDDDDILDNLSLDSRFYAKKVIRGLKIRSSVKSFVRQKKPLDFSSLPPSSSPASWLDASACWLDVFADL
ncbi:hypothetical protein Tco_0460927 [Tanacetum coccineum]